MASKTDKEQRHQYQTCGPLTPEQYENFILASITIASMQAAASIVQARCAGLRAGRKEGK